MATPRDVRRMALMALFQLDATGAEDPDGVRATLDDTESLLEEGLKFVDDPKRFKEADIDRAFAMALGAWEQRAAADAVMLELAPEWPAGRQAAIDRAILRLGHYEIVATDHPPKAVVNEAVELAKAFSTAKSPAFVNGLLGKFLKSHLAGAASEDAEPEPPIIETTGDTPAPAAAPEHEEG